MSDVDTSHPKAEQLTAYESGQLSGAEASLIRAHVNQCAACRGRLARPTAARPGQAAAESFDSGGATTVPPSLAASAAPLDVPAALVNHPRYRVLKLLGQGGMGAVYKAEHRLMERVVALKVINPIFMGSPAVVERFVREVKAAARLSNPYIVTAYDAEQAGDLHFLVMEYVEGVSLAQLIARKGPLPVQDACEYVRQGALGLQHAFTKGMVHRDIKPHNLMLTPRGRIKILDFGLARFLREAAAGGAAQSDEAEHALTGAGSLMGTPDYMAPEQGTDPRQADIRADIYSLGCTLYALLAGKPPFPGGTAVQKIMAHLQRAHRPVSELRNDVPVELDQLLSRVLAKTPAGRPQTPSELATALAPFVKPPSGKKIVVKADEPRDGPAFTAPGPAPIDALRRKRRRLAGLASAAVVLAAGGAVLTWSLSGSNISQPPAQLSNQAVHLETPATPPVDRHAPGVSFIAIAPPAVTIAAPGTAEFSLRIERHSYSGPIEFAIEGLPLKLGIGPVRPTLRSGADQMRISLDAPQDAERTKKQVKILARMQDAQGTWIKVAEATFEVEVRDRDSAEFVKTLPTPPPRPFLRMLPFDKNSLTLTPGTSVNITVEIVRQDSPAPVTVKVEGLPEKIACEPLILKAGQNKGTLVLRPAVDADEINAKVIQVVAAHPGAEPRDQIVTLTLQNPVFIGHTRPLLSVALSPDGGQLVSSAKDNTIRLWDVSRRAEVPKFPMQQLAIPSVAFSADSQSVFCGNPDGSIKQWRLSTAQQIGGPLQHSSKVSVTHMSVAGDGRHVLTQCEDRLLRLWDLRTRRAKHFRRALPIRVRHLAISPDASHIYVLGDKAGAFWLYEVDTTKEDLNTARGREVPIKRREDIQCAAVSDDGRRVLTGSADGTVRLWNVETGEQLCCYKGHTATIACVAFAPGGREVVSGGADSSVRLWTLPH